MVSEDSQDLGWLTVIHRLLDLRDLDDSRNREVPSERHQLDDRCELIEVLALRSPQLVLLEEGHDYLTKVSVSLNAVPEEILPMIVVSAIPVNLAAPQETNKLFEDVATRRSLNDGELRTYLPSQGHLAASVDGNTETTFAIYEPHDPSNGRESFLLIFRTPRIVTARHHTIVETGCDMNADE